jgi:tetratricopeptide (TPR) repeat protein
MPDDWFRSPAWDADAEADFERRLGRARSHNRPQYMRIKGLALADTGKVHEARVLWQRVLQSDAYDFEKAAAREHLADSYVGEDPQLAIELYRSVVGERSGTTSTQHIKLAELLLDRGTPEALCESGAVLTQWVDRQLPFPNAHFRWNLAVIRHAEALQDREAIREAAQRALDLADRGPVFSRHPTVGVVEADRDTLKRLRRLAGV